MGRNAKPTSLHLAEGNPNRLINAEIQATKDYEIKLGKSKIDKLPGILKEGIVLTQAVYKSWKSKRAAILRCDEYKCQESKRYGKTEPAIVENHTSCWRYTLGLSR